MKKVMGFIVSAIGALTMTSACTAEMDATDEVATQEATLCSNPNGINSVMSAIAVAAGKDMKRWLPYRDFIWNTSTDRLELSEHAAPRCPNRVCTNVQAVLDMQNAPSGSVKFPGNITLDPAALKKALKANWNEQVACTAKGTCVQEPYDLQYTNWEFGSCDVKYFFNVYPQGGGSRITDSARLDQLRDNLIFLGYPENRMLNYYLRNGQVSIDPTGGLNEGGTTSSGSCTAACTKFSTGNLNGQCCSCNGSVKNFKTSRFSSFMYQCH